MILKLADHIDQLDLALDQLALRDRNFDRFALLLIDNVVELVLHQYAQDKNSENQMWRPTDMPRYDPKAVNDALGQRFDKKVSFARSTTFISSDLAQSLLYLHSFRNTAYHRGLRHEGILHSLALCYLRSACDVLGSYSPVFWGLSSRDKLPHRSVKYLGNSVFWNAKEHFSTAWKRLREVADGLGNSLITDLHADMEKTISDVDQQIDFLIDSMPKGSSRTDTVVSVQAWALAFTDKVQALMHSHGGTTADNPFQAVEWVMKNYPLSVRVDPIAGWKGRLASLERERDDHAALKKYCDFMSQTSQLREQLDEAATQYDAHIQRQIDEYRGK